MQPIFGFRHRYGWKTHSVEINKLVLSLSPLVIIIVLYHSHCIGLSSAHGCSSVWCSESNTLGVYPCIVAVVPLCTAESAAPLLSASFLRNEPALLQCCVLSCPVNV